MPTKAFPRLASWRKSCARWSAARSASTRLRARSTLPTLPTTARCPSAWFCLWMRLTLSPPWRLAVSWAHPCSRAEAAPSWPASAAMWPWSWTSRNTCTRSSSSTRRKKFARVQPGIVLDRLRDAAEEHDLTFAPDPATHSRCTLGGMIGNNSCGVHALMGGKTVDNIESLDILLYDGTRLTVGRYDGSGTAGHHRRRRTPRARFMPAWPASGTPTAT